MKFVLKVASIFAILMCTFSEGAYAADVYNADDLAVLRAIKNDTPGIWPTLDLDNPTVEDVVISDEDAGMFPPDVKVGDVVRCWMPIGGTTDDIILVWIKGTDGEWRVTIVEISGAGVVSFDFSRLAQLPNLSLLWFGEDVGLTSVVMPVELQNLYGVEIDSQNVENVDVSKLTGLTAFELTGTKVVSLTLPPSSKLTYLSCIQNSLLTEVSGFYDKETRLEPSPGQDMSDIFLGNPLLLRHTITIAPTENGTITKNGGNTIYNGDSVTFTVAADSGYKVDIFQINGVPVTLVGNTYTHTATENITVAATFVEDSDPGDPTPEGGDNGGSGGCNAGFGLFGLLPLAVWVARKRMTA
jgi:hypothetical protein